MFTSKEVAKIFLRMARLARALRRRTERFFFSCSLVPLFFCCPIAVRSLFGCLSASLSGRVRDGLIFVVISDGYDSAPLSGRSFDHLFGFQPGQKPLDGARRPTPRLGKLATGGAELPAIERHSLARDVELGRLPVRFCDQPEPCAKACSILREEGVLQHFPVHDDEAAHARASQYSFQNTSQK